MALSPNHTLIQPLPDKSWVTLGAKKMLQIVSATCSATSWWNPNSQRTYHCASIRIWNSQGWSRWPVTPWCCTSWQALPWPPRWGRGWPGGCRSTRSKSPSPFCWNSSACVVRREIETCDGKQRRVRNLLRHCVTLKWWQLCNWGLYWSNGRLKAFIQWAVEFYLAFNDSRLELLLKIANWKASLLEEWITAPCCGL